MSSSKKLLETIDEKFENGADRGGLLGNRIVLPENYIPSVDEEFMNDNQLEYFRQKLLNWKLELLEEATDTKGTLSAEGLQRPDMADRAQVESDASIQLRTRDRERKLISKIDAALRRVKKTLNNITKPPNIVIKDGFFSYHKKFKIIEIGGIK